MLVSEIGEFHQTVVALVVGAHVEVDCQLRHLCVNTIFTAVRRCVSDV